VGLRIIAEIVVPVGFATSQGVIPTVDREAVVLNCSVGTCLTQTRDALVHSMAYLLSNGDLRDLPIPGSDLTVLIVSASCRARGDECICRNSAGLSRYLHSHLMSALGHKQPLETSLA
jgi:hypothetical protein